MINAGTGNYRLKSVNNQWNKQIKKAERVYAQGMRVLKRLPAPLPAEVQQQFEASARVRDAEMLASARALVQRVNRRRINREQKRASRAFLSMWGRWWRPE